MMVLEEWEIIREALGIVRGRLWLTLLVLTTLITLHFNTTSHTTTMNRNLEALLRWGKSSFSYIIPPPKMLTSWLSKRDRLPQGVENSPRPAGEGEAHDQSTAVAPALPSSSTSTSASSAQPLNASTGAMLPTATGSGSTASSSNKLDPGVLDAIMGKSDAQRMLEAVQDLKSQGKFSLEQKINIWDELELVCPLCFDSYFNV